MIYLSHTSWWCRWGFDLFYICSLDVQRRVNTTGSPEVNSQHLCIIDIERKTVVPVPVCELLCLSLYADKTHSCGMRMIKLYFAAYLWVSGVNISGLSARPWRELAFGVLMLEVMLTHCIYVYYIVFEISELNTYHLFHNSSKTSGWGPAEAAAWITCTTAKLGCPQTCNFECISSLLVRRTDFWVWFGDLVGEAHFLNLLPLTSWRTSVFIWDRATVQWCNRKSMFHPLRHSPALMSPCSSVTLLNAPLLNIFKRVYFG